MAEGAVHFLVAMFNGLGDTVESLISSDGIFANIWQSNLWIVRGIEGIDRQNLLDYWVEPWKGTITSYQIFMDLNVDQEDDCLHWELRIQRV